MKIRDLTLSVLIIMVIGYTFGKFAPLTFGEFLFCVVMGCFLFGLYVQLIEN